MKWHGKNPPKIYYPDPTLDPSESLNEAPPELEYKGFLTRGNSVVSEFDNPSPAELRSLLIAEENINKSTVVVKFASTYCAEAHCLLAHYGLAPKLHYCGCVLGEAYMVVMEFLEGYTRLEDFRREKMGILPETVVEDMKYALHQLHAQGLVHGDFRAPNILISPDGVHAIVIDFDWAAKEGEGHYIDTINKEELNCEWHEEVDVGKPMKKEHDRKALNIILGL